MMSALHPTYDGIFTSHPRQQSLTGRPGPVQASRKLMGMIDDARREHPTEEGFADWIANLLEGYGAHFAEPVLDLEGNGPKCSFCGVAPWPFCGHHHMSAAVDDETPPEHREAP